MSDRHFNRMISKIDKATYGKYPIFLVIAITAIGINYYYSTSMMFLSTFILAYLTKGSRCK